MEQPKIILQYDYKGKSEKNIKTLKCYYIYRKQKWRVKMF